MAYKISKYKGKHKIKDTKTGESVGIDIEKFMKGGQTIDPKKKKKKTEKKKSDPKSPDFSEAELKEINDATGIQFTADGANKLFARPDKFEPVDYPDLDLGRFKDVGYYDISLNGGNYVVRPTSKNYRNARTYKDDLRYLQKLNPNAEIEGMTDLRHYVTNKDRRPENYSEGGKYLVRHFNDGGNFECPPDDVNCQRMKSMGFPPPVSGDIEGYTPPEFGGLPLVDEEVKKRETVQAVNHLGDPSGVDLTGGAKLDVSKNVSDLEAYMASLNTGVATNEENINNNNNSNVNDDKNKDVTMHNPYAGVDIPSAAFTLGQSIESGNTLGIIGGGLKVATGLARNVFSGIGFQNRNDQVMKDYMEDQKNSKNPVQYFAHGGKKDEEIATGEYMYGIMNPDTERFNSEIEKGEYFQTNEGDIAEVIGDKHSKGGEKVQMEKDDRVLSDQLKLGAKTAKMLSKKYDMKLKAKNTYSDVLDKFRKKSKLDKILEEESEILKKIGEQSDVEDQATKNLNLDVLSKKKQEIAETKHPIEEQRKVMFDELFKIQEDSKPKKKETEEFAFGGDLKALAKEYGIPMDRAKELVQKFNDGGKKKYVDEGCPEGYEKNGEGQCVKTELDREEAEALDAVPEGQSRDTDTNLFGKVTPESFQESIKRNKWYFSQNPDFDVNDPEQVKSYQTSYNEVAERLGAPTVTVDGKWGEQTNSIDVRQFYKESLYKPEIDTEDVVINPEKIKERNAGLAGIYLFPDETPLPPTALQGTIKPERRFDRVSPTEIDAEPYLQDIRDNEEAAIKQLEGLSSNVRAAVLANMRANSQTQESNVRRDIDTQNMSSEERAIYANAQIQAREENASEADRLAYEQRQYRAQALTDLDLNNYYNQLQAVNKQRFMDIHNLNLVNAANEDVYFDGQTYRRKTSDRDILRQIEV